MTHWWNVSFLYYWYSPTEPDCRVSNISSINGFSTVFPRWSGGNLIWYNSFLRLRSNFATANQHLLVHQVIILIVLHNTIHPRTFTLYFVLYFLLCAVHISQFTCARTPSSVLLAPPNYSDVSRPRLSGRDPVRWCGPHSNYYSPETTARWWKRN